MGGAVVWGGVVFVQECGGVEAFGGEGRIVGEVKFACQHLLLFA